MIKWILGGLLLIVGGIVGVSLLRGADTPPAPKLPKAGAAASGELAGTLRPAAGSFVGYRVDETLIGIGLNTAVGRTDEVRDPAAPGWGSTSWARSRSSSPTTGWSRRASPASPPCATMG